MKNIIWKLGVLRMMLHCEYYEWIDTIWKTDPDEAMCCSGRDCCCRGSSIRECHDRPKINKQDAYYDELFRN